jgi:MFS family permease
MATNQNADNHDGDDNEGRIKKGVHQKEEDLDVVGVLVGNDVDGTHKVDHHETKADAIVLPAGGRAEWKRQKPIPLTLLYRYLQLETYTRVEMGTIFDRIAASANGTKLPAADAIDARSLQRFLVQRIRQLELEHDVASYPSPSSSTTTASSVSSGTTADDVAPSSSQCSEFDAQREAYATYEAERILQRLNPLTSSTNATVSDSSVITREHFTSQLTSLATAVDWKQAAPVFGSMLLVGSSVGIITPAMPFVVQYLELNASQYGAAVSAFGLAKMLGNVPAAIAVERHGRKPYMTYSLAVIALGVGGIGMAGSFEALYACRLLTGLGVAALSTAGTLMITDFSTPLNRASTYAPIMSAFAAGTALGPAIGGFLVDNIGLHPTFYAVGVSYLGVAAFNRFILSETKRQPMQFPWQRQCLGMKVERSEKEAQRLGDAVQGAVGQWLPLWKSPAVRSVMIMNGMYWVALAGAQMTVLPLLLTNSEGLNFTATQVGQVYMGMSVIQIVGNPVFAKVIDKVGKVPVIIGATSLIGTSMALLPTCCSADANLMPLAITLGFWSMGSSMLSTAPLAYISDKVDESQRAQAIALLRTCGDVGFLVGATAIGGLADWSGSLDVAMQSSAGLLLTATGWFAARQALTARLEAAAASAPSVHSK